MAKRCSDDDNPWKESSGLFFSQFMTFLQGFLQPSLKAVEQFAEAGDQGQR
jgi:hypothetical protein